MLIVFHLITVHYIPLVKESWMDHSECASCPKRGGGDFIGKSEQKLNINFKIGKIWLLNCFKTFLSTVLFFLSETVSSTLQCPLGVHSTPTLPLDLMLSKLIYLLLLMYKGLYVLISSKPLSNDMQKL